MKLAASGNACWGADSLEKTPTRSPISVSLRSLIDPISSLMESMMAGTLTDEEARRLDELIAARHRQQAAADLTITALVDERARRDTNIRIAIALAEAHGYLNGVSA